MHCVKPAALSGMACHDFGLSLALAKCFPRVCQQRFGQTLASSAYAMLQ